MAHKSQIICDLCGDAEEDGGGRIPAIQRIVFCVGPPTREHDILWKGFDLCERCRVETIGNLKAALKLED